MKKYIKLITLILTISLFTACDKKDELIIFNTPEGFIQLASVEASILENSTDELVTTVLFGGESNATGITVNYTVTSSDPSRYTVTPSSGTIDIPAGEYKVDIILQTVDNFDVDGNVDVTIELTSNSSKPIGLGGEGLRSVSKTITIVDNDCPIDINAWVGTYTVEEKFTGGGNAPFGLSDFFAQNYQVELSLAPGDITGTKVVITNSAGFNTYFDDGIVMSFDTCNKKVSFDAGFPRVALFRTFEFTDSAYNEDAFRIVCSGPLDTFGPYEFVLTKQ